MSANQCFINFIKSYGNWSEKYGKLLQDQVLMLHIVLMKLNICVSKLL